MHREFGRKFIRKDKKKNMLILTEPVSREQLIHIEEKTCFEDMMKCVADIERGLLPKIKAGSAPPSAILDVRVTAPEKANQEEILLTNIPIAYEPSDTTVVRDKTFRRRRKTAKRSATALPRMKWRITLL